MTQNGKAILEIVERSEDHPTAEDIFKELRAEGNHMSIATVYNNLNSLAGEGRIRRLSVDGRTDRFDRTARHDHMVCSVCGRIRDLWLDDLTGVFERASGEKVDSYDLNIFYVCEDCRRKETVRE
ncbi:MAG: transcriptional repressor [Lachnospiraceae bacterium]|nr:transcriptional repressor [Lachnospiraceae bacterium]